MSEDNKRVVMPFFAACGGTVTNLGWLELGGWRIGITSDNGIYYYYAHLDSYADNMAEGTKIRKGQLIGYMGDSGYSKVEGTVGKFDVHLHFGIYLNDENKQEFSVNSYSILQYLYQEKKILHYQY